MRSGLVILLCLLVLCSFSINIEPSVSQTDPRTMEIEQMVDFLTETQFNESLGLCSEAPNVAPSTYWLVSDNLWAYKALMMASTANLSNSERAGVVAGKIESSLKDTAAAYDDAPRSANAFPKSYCHEAVLGQVVLPPYRTATDYQLYKEANYTLKMTVCDGTEMADWERYADRLLVAALSYHWQGDDTSAKDCFSNAVEMWNDTSGGLQDIVADASGKYAVYKLALLLYTSKILGESLPFEDRLVERLYFQQEQDSNAKRFGGIRTDYLPNGALDGDANTETTAMVLIALLTPATSIPATPEMPWTLAIIGLVFASSVAVVLVLKRPFEHFSRWA